MEKDVSNTLDFANQHTMRLRDGRVRYHERMMYVRLQQKLQNTPEREVYRKSWRTHLNLCVSLA